MISLGVSYGLMLRFALTRIDRYFACMLGSMGGMYFPGVLKGVYGTYCASLLLSFAASAVAFVCFVCLALMHPMGGAHRVAPPSVIGGEGGGCRSMH